VTAAVFSVPAALVLSPQPPVTDFLMPLTTTVTGIALLLVPARWMSDWWLYVIIGGGTLQCEAGVAVFGGDYSFYFVIPAIYAAYTLPSRRQFAAALVVMTLAFSPRTSIAAATRPWGTTSTPRAAARCTRAW
jgi:hypothetical protein